jgi:hypothetical protein
MLQKAVSLGFSLSTLPARLAYRRVAPLLDLPPDLDRALTELRAGSDQVLREIQGVLQAVDQDMNARTQGLSAAEREQAAELAVRAAEQHLSMAAVNLLRALWLGASARRELERDSVVIDQRD